MGDPQLGEMQPEEVGVGDLNQRNWGNAPTFEDAGFGFGF